MRDGQEAAPKQPTTTKIPSPCPNLPSCRATASVAISGAARGKRSACPTTRWAASRSSLLRRLPLRSQTRLGQPDYTRRTATGLEFRSACGAVRRRHPCRLPIGGTADCQSALQPPSPPLDLRSEVLRLPVFCLPRSGPGPDFPIDAAPPFPTLARPKNVSLAFRLRCEILRTPKYQGGI